jgi:hypothetical protein
LLRGEKEVHSPYFFNPYLLEEREKLAELWLRKRNSPFIPISIIKMVEIDVNGLY